MVIIRLIVQYFIIFALLFPRAALTEEFNITRINTDFANAWQALKDKVEEYEYNTAYLQRCDFALTERNYKSDRYRILFFGTYDDMEYLSRKYPELVPYLPLKVVVMEEGQNVLLINNPIGILLELVNEEDSKIVTKWESDLTNIFKEIQETYD